MLCRSQPDVILSDEDESGKQGSWLLFGLNVSMLQVTLQRLSRTNFESVLDRLRDELPEVLRQDVTSNVCDDASRNEAGTD